MISLVGPEPEGVVFLSMPLCLAAIFLGAVLFFFASEAFLAAIRFFLAMQISRLMVNANSDEIGLTWRE